MKALLFCALACASITVGICADDTQAPVPLDPLLADEVIGRVTAKDFAATYRNLQVPRISTRPAIDGYEEIAHADGRVVTLLQLPIADATVFFREGRMEQIFVDLVDRGHAVALTHDEFNALLKQWVDAITARTGAAPVISAQNAVPGAYTASTYHWPGTAFSLKVTYTNEDAARRIPFRAEEINVSLMPINPTEARVVPASKSSTAKAAEPDPQWKIPKSFSLRSEYEKMDLAPKNQGRRGSCTVFATVGVMEFHMARQGDNAKLSEQFAAWAADEATNHLAKREGYSVDDLIKGIQTYGITTDGLMPYKTGSIGHPSREALADAATRKHIGVTWFHQWNPDSKDGFTMDQIRAICGSIAEGSPVSAGCAWPQSTQLDGGDFVVDHRNIPASNMGGGHVVVLMGYEIDPSLDGGGAFLFRQSWGDQWGDGGYAKLSFDYLRKHGAEAYAVKLF